MKKILCLFLIPLLVLPLSACKPNYTDEIVGKWETTIDMTANINAELAASFNTEVRRFSLTSVYEFRKDGTYTCTVDRTALMQTIAEYAEALKAGMKAYMQDQLIQQGSSQTIDEYMAAENTTFEEWFASNVSEEGLAEPYLQIEKEGTYKLNGDQLFLSDSSDGEINEEKCEYIEIKGDTMRFVLPENTELADSEVLDSIDLSAFYPLSFRRI